jgi:hypothetical protein
MEAMKPRKARIKQNAWGNWYGYLGVSRVESFANTPYESAEQMAQRWLQLMQSGTDYNDQDYKRRTFKRVLGAK